MSNCMFSGVFQETWREKRAAQWQNLSSTYKENGRGYVSTLKNVWSNFETEMMASVYSEMLLQEVLSDDLNFSNSDLKEPARFEEAVNGLSEYLRQDNGTFHGIFYSSDYPVSDLGEPYYTIIKTFLDAVDFREIAVAFLEKEKGDE